MSNGLTKLRYTPTEQEAHCPIDKWMGRFDF